MALTSRPPCPGVRVLGEGEAVLQLSALLPKLPLTLELNSFPQSSSPSFAVNFLNQN